MANIEVKRQTITITDRASDRLKELGDHYGASQWKLLDALLRLAKENDSQIRAALEELQDEVKAEKKRKKALREKLKYLSDEEIEELLAKRGQ